jgi:hypothetical protein
MIATPTTADKAPSLDNALDELRSFIATSAQAGASFHDFELGLWRRLLRLGRQATHTFLASLGSGDLGENLALPDGQGLRRLDQTHDRDFTCIFGTFTLSRTCYGSREGQKINFVPLDSRLALPAGKFSYLLQDWDLLLATEHPFAKVADVLERILGLTQHTDSLQRLCRAAGVDVEPFRAALPAPPAAEEGAIVVQSGDGKGVPTRRPADAPPIRDHDHKRGPKPDRKKKAIVGTVYTIAPLVRTAEQVVETLFRQPGQPGPEQDRPRPCHKRVCARLNEYTDEQGQPREGLADVFVWMSQQLRLRNPNRDREVVHLFDGEETLWQVRELCQPTWKSTGILDLLHVTPRLWQVARLFHPADSPEALALVRDRVLRVLRGQVDAVVRGLRQMGTRHRLKGSKAKELKTICAYLEKNRARMRYDEYLKKGYPIASGAIEGACRHYVKDRMERTGMSWVKPGAQAMLELRSTALNGDWDDFMTFRIDQETARLHPHRHAFADVSWPMAV